MQFFKNHFWSWFPKNWMTEWILRMIESFLLNCQSGVTNTGSWITPSSFFVNCNQKTFSKKWKKSLKSMHLHEKASLGTTLWLFQKCIKHPVHTGCPKKNARLRLETNNFSLEGAIGICKTIFGFLRFSAFIWAQEVQNSVHWSLKKLCLKRATLTWKWA